MQQQPQQPPNFNQRVCLPTGNAIQAVDSPEAKEATEKMEQLYVQGGVIPQHIAEIVCGPARSEVVTVGGFDEIQDYGQPFILIPAVLLDPNLRNTSVMEVIAPQVAAAIELHHVGEEAKHQAIDLANQKAANK